MSTLKNTYRPGDFASIDVGVGSVLNGTVVANSGYKFRVKTSEGFFDITTSDSRLVETTLLSTYLTARG